MLGVLTLIVTGARSWGSKKALSLVTKRCRSKVGSEKTGNKSATSLKYVFS